MKKLITAAIASLAISISSPTPALSEVCTATDQCILFATMNDITSMAVLYQQGGDAFKFAINEMLMSGKLIKIDSGRPVTVIAKSGPLYQVLLNNKIYYTINLAVECK